MKESIKTLVQQGLVVTTGYKKKVKDWYVNVDIYMYNNKYRVVGGPFNADFDDIDTGVKFYIDEILSVKNIGWIWKRLRIKGILTEDMIDSMSDDGTFRVEKYKKIYEEAMRTEKTIMNLENMKLRKPI